MSEKRLSEKQELILYRIAIRQDEQDRQPSLLYKKTMLEDPIYTELLDLEYLAYEEYGEGDEAIASLFVTLAGERYCVKHIDEIAKLDRESRPQF